MKKITKKLLASTIAASALAVSAIIPAHAEVSASVGASNMYYWRGYDLGLNGDAAIWGDINVSGENGLYAGLWTSSGDGVLGTEYDVYFGWGGEVGGLGVDVSYWSYIYPNVMNGEDEGIFLGDFAELVLGLSYGNFAFTYYDNIAVAEDFFGPGSDFGSDEYSYFTLAVDIDKFNIKYGQHADAEGSALDGYAHLDITYNYNDNLSFTMGNVVDDVDDANNDQIKFVVNFGIPIE